MKRLVGASMVCVVLAGSAMAETKGDDVESRSESLEKDALALTIIGGVTLAAAAGFAYASNDISDQIANHDLSQPWPNDIFQLEREGQRLQTLSFLTGAAGGVFIVTGALCYWRSRVAAREEREERVIVSPIATPSSAGIALSGAF